MDRLTTDNPANNLETGMNYCFAKDGTATLNYADSAENVNLCDYTAKYCCKNGCEIDAAYVLQEGLTDCYDCQIATMYYLGVQAAETRERLKYYEDLAEQGRLVVLPCKVGDTVPEFDRLQQENKQLRELVRLAVEDMKHCVVDTGCEVCLDGECEGFDDCDDNFVWHHADKLGKLGVEV